MKPCSSLVFLFLLIVIGEILPILEAFKSVRPYKYYHPRSSHRPRWHPGPKPPKRYRPWKRPPPRRYPRYKPRYHRYPAPAHYENGIDYASEDQPYTIEIELPKRNGGTSGRYNKYPYDKRGHNRGEVYDEPEYEDYAEEEYSDGRDRVIRTGEKKVRIKVIKGLKPKLNIRISRIDEVKVNETESGPQFQPQISSNLQKLETQSEEEWVPENPRPSYPVHLRGA